MRYAMLALVVVIVAAVSIHQEAQPQPPSPDIVGPNDLLCIGIWDTHPTGGETLKTVRVDPQGNVSLYYIGQLKIAGMNFAQAEDAIIAAYRNSGVVKDTFASLNRLESGQSPSIQSGAIQPGDRISVALLDLVPEVRHARILTVSPGGAVGLPMLGQFRIAGLTEASAETAIQRAMSDKFNINNLAVSVLRLSPRQFEEPTVAAPGGFPAVSDGSRARK